MPKAALAHEVRLFIPIVKVDAETRTVYGQMTAENVDSSDEIWDYEGSKPYFEAWTSNAEKSSGGKSLGNLRAMHQPIAAGKLTQFVMDDDTREVLIAAKVVDDGEWKKVEEGVYTGFSQGGKYVKRWKDPDDNSKTRYISDPVEVSLVDLPCLPTATFEYIKAGMSEMRKFTTHPEETSVDPTNEEVAARATEMAKAAGDETKWPDHLEAARTALKAEMAPAPETEEPTEETETDEEVVEETKTEDADKVAQSTEVEAKAARKAARDSLVQMWHTPDGQHFVRAADAVAHVMGETPPANPVQAALKAAMGEDVPMMVKFEPTEGLDVAQGAISVLVEKGLYTAGRALEVLDSVVSLQCSSAWEAEYERDGSTVPGMLADAVRALGAAALAMASEEIAEAIAGLKTGEEDVVVVDYFENAAQAEFVKSIEGDEELMKAGARNSSKDKKSIQAVHDEAVKLGADCGMDKAASEEELAKRAETDPVLKSFLDERETLKTQVSEAVEGIGTLGEELRKVREELRTIRTTATPLPPNARVVGKATDNNPDATEDLDLTKAEALIAGLSKTPEGQRVLAEAAIKASQMATLGTR